jgi:hypothetical protein
MTTIASLRSPTADLYCCRSLNGRDTAQQFAPFLRQTQLPAGRCSSHLNYQTKPHHTSTRAIHRITARCAYSGRLSTSTKSP